MERAILQRLVEIDAKIDRLFIALENLHGTGPGADLDDRHGRLLRALAGVEGIPDGLPFDAAEVITHARVDVELDAALKALDVKTTATLGCVFRELKGQTINGLRLERDGRVWQLV